MRRSVTAGRGRISASIRSPISRVTAPPPLIPASPGCASWARTRSRNRRSRRALVSVKRLTGAVTLLTSGCSLYSAVVCTGDVGRVIHYDDDRVVETDDTLVGWYARWLDEEIAPFEVVQRLQEAGASLDDMAREMKRLLPGLPAPIVRIKTEDKLRGITTLRSAPGS